MPYGSVTAQGLFKLADINMEKRRFALHDKQQAEENRFRLGQEERLNRQESRLEKQFASEQDAARVQKEQAARNLELLNNQRELEGIIGKAAASAPPGQAFNAGWDALSSVANDPKYAPLYLTTRNKLISDQAEVLKNIDLRDPTKKTSTKIYNETIGAKLGDKIDYIRETPEGTITKGWKQQQDGTWVEKQMLLPKDGSAPIDLTPQIGLASSPTAAHSTDSTLKKLIIERDALPAGSKNRKLYDDLIAKETTKGSGQNITINTSKTEAAVLEPVLKELPKAREAALNSAKSIKRVDQALDIVDKEGDSIVGISGAIKRGLAPYASAIGMNTSKMTDAQILDSLLSQGAGSLRMEVVGPGPVSNYENGILQSVSGKNMSAAEGVKRILEYQRQAHADNIAAYNDQVSSIAGEPGYKVAEKIYKPIKINERAQKANNEHPEDIAALINKYGGGK